MRRDHNCRPELTGNREYVTAIPKITKPPTTLIWAWASGSIMCPGPLIGLPTESNHARMGRNTCSTPCTVPMKKNVAAATKNFSRWKCSEEDCIAIGTTRHYLINYKARQGLLLGIT